MNCWFWVWFLHFSFWNLQEIYQPAERGVVLSRNQIAAIGLPESWVNCLAEAAEPHWWQEFWPSNRWFSSCSARVMWKLATLEKCWNPTRETNGKGRKNLTTPQDLSATKIARAKKEAGFFSHFSRLCWMLELNQNAWLKMFEFLFKIKKNGKWSCFSVPQCHLCRIRFNGSMEIFQKTGFPAESQLSNIDQVLSLNTFLLLMSRS